MMKVEDYMRLPKRRLAELLVEKDLQHPYYPYYPQYPLYPWIDTTPNTNPDCYHGGPCTNPHHDCINCPHQSLTDARIEIGPTTATFANEKK